MSQKTKGAKGKIVIEGELCKSCGYCMEHCPKHLIVLGKAFNAKGYFPAQPGEEGCNGCGICALVCPEAIIEVFRE